jgi:hypothetical protein
MADRHYRDSPIQPAPRTVAAADASFSWLFLQLQPPLLGEHRPDPLLDR